MKKFILALTLMLLVSCLLAPQALAAGNELRLPASLTVIEDEAFRGSGAKTVYIPDKVTSIGALAFADCAGMTVIHIPASVTEIAADAFDGHNSNLTIYAPDRSAAKAYANQHGISFRVEKNEYVLPEI